MSVFDGTKFTLLDRIDFGEGSDPDNLRYDAAAKQVYLGYGEGAIAVIDPVTNKRLPTNTSLRVTPKDSSSKPKVLYWLPGLESNQRPTVNRTDQTQSDVSGRTKSKT